MTSLVAPERGDRSVWKSLTRGMKLRCPSCGNGRIFRKFLKVADHCEACEEDFHHHRADDAPPYFTIFIVGHVIVPLMLWIEMAYRPDLWIHGLIWGPLTIVLSLATLPVVKGAVVGLQWALRMHGFGGHED